jgi:hypothetical protein
MSTASRNETAERFRDHCHRVVLDHLAAIFVELNSAAGNEWMYDINEVDVLRRECVQRFRKLLNEGAVTAVPDELKRIRLPKTMKARMVIADVERTVLVHEGLKRDEVNTAGLVRRPKAITKDLPAASDIDPARIPFGQKILTKDGWLLSTQEKP